jgi:hypothetical protein
MYLIYVQQQDGWKPVTLVHYEHEAKQLMNNCDVRSNTKVYSDVTCRAIQMLRYVEIPYKELSSIELLAVIANIYCPKDEEDV